MSMPTSIPIDEDFGVPPGVLIVEKLTEKPMTSRELLDEVEWLLDAGLSPQLVAVQVGRNTIALEKAAERARRLDLARRIRPVSEWERRWNAA